MIASPRNGSAQSRSHIFLWLEAFPDAHRLKMISMLAFTSVVSARVTALQSFQFLYNGQSVRLDGHFKKAKLNSLSGTSLVVAGASVELDLSLVSLLFVGLMGLCCSLCVQQLLKVGPI